MDQTLIGALRGVPAAELPAYLGRRSGLPGPRANLALADAFSAVAAPETVLDFVHRDDEYLRFCGTEAVGRLILDDPDDPSLLVLLRERSTDPSWRVREGAARALQLIGAADSGRLREIVALWVEDPEPFVRRAAIAGICEPPLLRDEANAAAALAACERATDSFSSFGAPERKAESVRKLRQALGYCWSVAVAAAPEEGVPAFERLRAAARNDADLDWIVKANLAKARLRSHFEAAPAS